MPAKKEEPKEIVVQRIRVNRSHIKCEWMQGDDPYKVTFHDNPLPSLYKALEALPPHVCSLSEFHAKDEDKIEATGITISMRGDTQLATITAKKTLKRNKRVLNVSTPLLPMYVNKENEAADHMSEEEARAVEKLIKEAKKYILGERAQGKLAFEEEQPEGKKGKNDPAANVEEFPELRTPQAAGT